VDCEELSAEEIVGRLKDPAVQLLQISDDGTRELLEEAYEWETQNMPTFTGAFAWRQGIGDEVPSVSYTILRGNETWHDHVKHDGASYSSIDPLPKEMHSTPGETRAAFEKRVNEVARKWEFGFYAEKI
jgi:hypothetical protein